MNLRYFDDLLISHIQVQILSYLYYYEINHKRGISREELESGLKIPRTTIYDNILRLNRSFESIVKRTVLTGSKGAPIKRFHLHKRFLEGLEHVRNS
jgi:hypothetical protein